MVSSAFLEVDDHLYILNSVLAYKYKIECRRCRMILIGMAIFLDVLGMYFLEPNILVSDAHIPSFFPKK